MIHYGTKDTMEGKMQEIIKMPHLGETMEEGKIVSFYVKEGDYVKKGDLLFETETDKTVLTVESFKEGYIRKIYVKEGDVVKVDEPVILLTTTKDEPFQDQEGEAGPLEKKEERPKVEPPQVKKETREKVLATPLAKKLAEEYGIDLSDIKPEGERIKRKDVERYIESMKKESSKVDITLSHARRSIGDKMVISKTTIPHFYLTISVDMEKAKEAKNILNKEKGWELSYTDFLLKALAKSLLLYPHLNAHFIKDRGLEVFQGVNIGIALDTEEALLVPVMREVEKKGIEEISEVRRELVKKASDKKLTPQDMEGATFTISNLGPYNIEEFSAIINPPQVGILAVGKILDTPVVLDGNIIVRPIMKLTLSADHRAVDGAYGAKFLDTLRRFLENPILMWE